MANTPNLNLPKISGNMSADVVRDVNALADAVDAGAAKASDLVAHKADYVAHPAFAVTAGTANAYTVTLTPAPTAYIDGMGIVLAFHASATGASTLNINGLGAKPLKSANGNNASNLLANGVYTFRYKSGNFILQGEGVDPTDLINATNGILGS